MAGNRSLIGRLGGLSNRAKNNPLLYTKAARASGPGNLAYWMHRVDPDEELPEEERESRAVAAKKAHYLRLAMLSSEARKKAS